MTGIVVIKAGVFDNGGASKFKPAIEMFTACRAGFLTPIAGTGQFERAYEDPPSEQGQS